MIGYIYEWFDCIDYMEVKPVYTTYNFPYVSIKYNICDYIREIAEDVEFEEIEL